MEMELVFQLLILNEGNSLPARLCRWRWILKAGKFTYQLGSPQVPAGCRVAREL